MEVSQLDMLEANRPQRIINNPTKRGFAAIAETMNRDTETANFRRFGELSMHRLLRLQEELLRLEQQLSQIAQREKAGNPADPAQPKEEGGSTAPTRQEVMSGIDEKLGQYNSLLLQEVALRNLDPPRKEEKLKFSEWLRSLNPNMVQEAESVKTIIWSPEHGQDLITLRRRQPDDDVFSRFLTGTLLGVYNGLYGHHREASAAPVNGLIEYEEDTLVMVSKAIGAILSSTVPTLTILVLYFVTKMIVRIALMIVFTALFSLSLTVFTAAKKVEIFSATAAFAAVEVVFIGSTNGAV